MTVTAANPLPEDLAISDEVIRLRVWGTDQVFLLFPDRHEALIGTAATCAIRLHDPMRRVSRAHAFLQRLQGQWGIADRASKNGSIETVPGWTSSR